MKYMAIIDADEKPVSCEFIGCNGNVAPYLIGATDNIKALEQEPMLDKIRAEIENHCGLVKENHCKYCSYCNSVMGVREIIEIIDKYRGESEDKTWN